VASYIEVTEGDDQMSDEELVRFINTHDMMLQEEAFVETALEMLEADGPFNPALVTQLRELGRNEGFSNIGISDQD
jgi:hypothetical protein